MILGNGRPSRGRHVKAEVTTSAYVYVYVCGIHMPTHICNVFISQYSWNEEKYVCIYGVALVLLKYS